MCCQFLISDMKNPPEEPSPIPDTLDPDTAVLPGEAEILARRRRLDKLFSKPRPAPTEAASDLTVAGDTDTPKPGSFVDQKDSDRPLINPKPGERSP
jgi:hypothetical protein